MQINHKFKSYIAEYCAELDGEYTDIINEIRDFYDTNMSNMTANSSIGYHSLVSVDVVLHNSKWYELWHIVKRLFDRAELNLDYSEFAHTLQFIFPTIKPGAYFPAHTDADIRSMSCVNVPLYNDCTVSLYNEPVNTADDEDNVCCELIGQVTYTNPILLNTNNWHGVPMNETEHDRITLKINMPIVPWDKLIKSKGSDDAVKLFDFVMPWDLVKKQRIRF